MQGKNGYTFMIKSSPATDINSAVTNEKSRHKCELKNLNWTSQSELIRNFPIFIMTYEQRSLQIAE